MPYEKKSVIESYKTHPTDTGSPEVQIALLTARINYLSDHFKKHLKDHSSRNGFLKLINHRRTLIEYLKKHNPAKHKEILSKLELRK
jgi:small subunit ribosomal protein S15